LILTTVVNVNEPVFTFYRQTQWDAPAWDVEADDDEEDDMDLGTPTFSEPRVSVR